MIKRLFILFSVYTIILSCKTNKKVETQDTNCEIVTIPKEQEQELVSMYKKMDTSYFFKNQVIEFDKINNGILYFQKQDGFENGSFLIIDFDANFSMIKKVKDYNKTIQLGEEDKNRLTLLLNKLVIENYYQTCNFAENHPKMHVLIVKKNNVILVNYFSPFESPFAVKPINENFKNTQTIFEITNRNFYQK